MAVDAYDWHDAAAVHGPYPYFYNWVSTAGTGAGWSGRMPRYDRVGRTYK